MDYKVVHSLVGAIIFLVMASPTVYSALRGVVKDPDMSLVVRSILVGLINYLLMATTSL
jgi:hypothetical protein